MQENTITKVLKDHTDSLMALPGVVGIGQGLCDGVPCIKVFVMKDDPELMRQIPSTIEGHPVVIEVSGGFSAFGSR